MLHRISPSFLIFIFSIILLFVNFFWIKTYNPHPLRPDEALNLLENFRYYSLLRHLNVNNLKEIFRAESLYPPFYGLLGACFNLIFGHSSWISILCTNIFCFLILFTSIYHIGRKLFNRDVGILSMIFLSSFPLLIASTRWFFHEFALTAIVALSMLCLIKTENFKDLRFSLLLGALIFIGLLTKWTYPLFLSGPLMVEFGLLLREKDKRKRIFNFFTAILAGGSLALILWYIPNLPILYPGIKQGQIRISSVNVDISTLRGVLFYVKSLPFHINPFNCLLLLIFLPSLVSEISKRENLFLISWFLFPLLVLTLLPNKWSCYFMPAIPSLSLMLSRCLLNLKGDRYLH